MQIEDLPSPNRSSRLPGDPIDLIVVHSTVGTFESSLNWLRSPASKVSIHYLISQEGRICRLVREAEQAWHAGVSFWRGRADLNRYSIGIELANRTGMEGFEGQEPYPAEQTAACVWLLRDICARRDILPSAATIVSHMDIAPRRKHDPIGYDMKTLRTLAGASEPPPSHNRTFYVVPTQVNIRQGPGTAFPIAGQAYRGQVILVDAVVDGEKIGANAGKWVHLARVPPTQFDLGFISANLVREG